MKKTLDFYANPDELQDWLTGWIDRFELHAVGCKFFPRRRTLLPHNPASEDHSAISFGEYDEIVFGPDLDALARFSADLKSSDYPSGFRIMPPRMTDEGLRSGAMDLIQKEPIHLLLWKSLVADVKRHTTAGMWVYSPFTQCKGFYKYLRYAPGIVDLTQRGVKLLPIAGDNVVTIDEPQQPQPDAPTGTTP